MSEFRNIVERAIETSRRCGAQKVMAKASSSRTLGIGWRKAKIEELTSANESSLSLALFVDGRYGIYSTSDTRAESVDAFIEKCVAMTRLLEEDPARDLADPARYANRHEGDIGSYDAAAEARTPAALIARCKELEAIALAHSELPIVDVTSGEEVSVTESYTATTNGFSGERRGTSFGSYVSIVVDDGDKKPSDYAQSATRFLSDLRDPQAIADEAARFVGMKIGQKKLASGNRTLILDRRVASQLLRKFLSPLTGTSLIRKNSYFLDRVGDSFGSALLDLHDDPWLVRGLASRVFDGDCMSTAPAHIFQAGVLQQYFLDVYAANKLGAIPTTDSWSNLVLTPGKRSLDAMIADVDDGIYVTSLLGGNQDSVRGDFSHGIVGVAIEKGKLTVPVSEMNITGNHLDLWKRLSEVGNDVCTDTSHRIPSVRIDDVSVSGT